MGTNFFWRDQPCGSCGRYDEIHVGKSSAGWSFLFRGYPHKLESEQHPEWGHDSASPFGFAVLSRADWRKVMAERPGDLRDEYGRKVEENPFAWLDRLEPPTAEQVRRETGELNRSSYRPGADKEWRDAEGFRFYSGEFS